MKIQPAMLFAALCLPMAHAEFTYVDATPTNTTLNGVTLLDRNTDPTNGNYFNQFNTPNAIGTATDTFWSFNNLTGYESSNYFQCDNVSTADDAEATAPLVTTINLPTIGTYKVLAMFTRSSSRDIAAKIGSAPGTADVFTIYNAANAGQTLTPLQIDFDSSYTDARGVNNAGAAFLGQITTTAPNQAVLIYVNGLVGIDGTQDERTQYDGIGYELVPAATGEYTYVDASISNTTLNSDPVNFPNGVALVDTTADPINGNCVNNGTGGAGSDNLWAFRTDLAAAADTFEGDTFFESDNGTEFGTTNTGTDRETTADLITTINPPAAGVYQVVAVFTKTSLRDIAAKIGSSPGAGNVFSDTNALEANQLASPLEIDFDAGYTNGRLANSGAAYLGTVVTTSANEAVKVHVNGRAHNAINDDERTQYDGIAYRLVSTGGGNTFANWISGFNVGSMNGLGDDADGDGTDNGVENIFGTAPNAFSAGLLVGTKSGNTFTFTHPQSATPASDLSPSYKWSTDLASWYLGNGIDGPGGSTVTLTPNTVSGTTTVTATTSGPLPQLFLRVQVNQN